MVYIDNESIIILNSGICESFLEGELSFEITQSIESSESTPNHFIQIPSVIQCVNPSVSDASGKLKFSVVNKQADTYDLKYASVIFSHKISAVYEIRGKERSEDGECSFDVIKIWYDKNTENLCLDFIDKSDDENLYIDKDDISNSISEENNELESDIDNFKELINKNKRLLEQKSQIQKEFEDLVRKVENLENMSCEIADLNMRKEKLERDKSENSENLEKADKLKSELSYYDDILEYYRNDKGYDTVFQKLSKVAEEIEEIKNHISMLAQNRADEIMQIDDKLNI